MKGLVRVLGNVPAMVFVLLSLQAIGATQPAGRVFDHKTTGPLPPVNTGGRDMSDVG